MSSRSRRARRIQLCAAAKVNLALEILGRRADGYHEIVTVMQAVELSDVIVLEEAETIALATRAAGVPTDATNLAVRAALTLRQAAGIERGVRIILDKRIPVAAGLGGGSADAAAVLFGLNRLWDLRWPAARLADVGVTLGMDVPFFLTGGTALGTGRGETLERLPGRQLALVLLNPGYASSTAAAYGRLTPAMYTDGARARAVVKALEGRRADTVAATIYNGLETAVTPAQPEIERMKAALMAAGALGAAMSGSGPTVFGVARSLDHARQIQRRVRRPSWECWAVRTLVGPAIRRRDPRTR